MGVGIENYNDYLLEQLAQHGNGWYRYLSEVGQARSTFSRENWLALSVPFADQARAQVTWEPEVVRSWRIVGYENRVTPDATFTQDRKEFAELPSGTATTVFYELELHQRAERQRGGQVGSVELAWVDPYTGENRRQRSDLSGSLTTDFRRTPIPCYNSELSWPCRLTVTAGCWTGRAAAIGKGPEAWPRCWTCCGRSSGTWAGCNPTTTSGSCWKGWNSIAGTFKSRRPARPRLPGTAGSRPNATGLGGRRAKAP